MKKAYTQPTLVAYGNVEQLTQGNRAGNTDDSINFVGGPLDGVSTPGSTFGLTGSQDVQYDFRS